MTIIEIICPYDQTQPHNPWIAGSSTLVAWMYAWPYRKCHLSNLCSISQHPVTSLPSNTTRGTQPYKYMELPTPKQSHPGHSNEKLSANLRRSEIPLKLPGVLWTKWGPPGSRANYSICHICRGHPACREWTQSSLQVNSWLIIYISMFR